MAPSHFNTSADSASFSTNTGLFGTGRQRGGMTAPSFVRSPSSVTCTRPWYGGR